MVINSGLMAINGRYEWLILNSYWIPSGNLICYIAIENGPVEIVDESPLIAWWIFPVRYVNVYQAG